MRLTEADLADAETRLRVTLPTSFRAFLRAHDLTTYVSWSQLHPREWHRAQNDEQYPGPPGIVFAHGAGSEYYLLVGTEEDPSALGPAVWCWDLHEEGLTRVARAIDQLPEVLDQAASALLDE